MKKIPNYLTNKARQLRREQTDAERFLWQKLRNKRFEGFRFRRQVVIGPYVVDFYCVKARLIIELDGGQHNLEAHVIYDEIRTKYLQRLNNKVLRFWNNEVFLNTDGMLETIYDHLMRRFS